LTGGKARRDGAIALAMKLAFRFSCFIPAAVIPFLMLVCGNKKKKKK